VLASTESRAEPVLRFGQAPDANPPAASALGVPCLEDFSAPTAAANLLGFLEVFAGEYYPHWNGDDVTAGLPLPVVAEHLSWFMGTNSRRDSGCASVAIDTWGRTNARTGGTEGTRNRDLAPGLVEYVRWDDGLHPFPGPSPRPSLPPGKRAYDWRMQTFLNPDPGEVPDDVGFVHDYAWYVYSQPVLVTFRHWHLTFLCAEGGIEYYDWLPAVSGTDDPAFAPSYSGGGAPPAEHWNGDNLGHAALGIGFHPSYQPSCTSAPRDWFIVHDGIPNTGENVAVPFFYDENWGLSWLTSFTIMKDAVIEPDLAVDASGNRHVVWAGGIFLAPESQIYYEGNAGPGIPLSGTQIGWGADPSIAIDPNTGHVAIAFSTRLGLSVSTNSLGYWNEEDLDSPAPLPGKTALAIDSSSGMHVVWQAGCDGFDWCPLGRHAALLERQARRWLVGLRAAAARPL
jgi:hypothetical protein